MLKWLHVCAVQCVNVLVIYYLFNFREILFVCAFERKSFHNKLCSLTELLVKLEGGSKTQLFFYLLYHIPHDIININHNIRCSLWTTFLTHKLETHSWSFFFGGSNKVEYPADHSWFIQWVPFCLLLFGTRFSVIQML